MARRFAPYAFLALIPLLALWQAVFGGLAIGPHDQVAHFGPWNRTGPMGAWDILPMDGVIQFHVWRDLVFSAWRGGEIPFWNPYSLGGTPLLANSQSGAMYPFHILFGILGLPTAGAIALLAWIHLGVAGVGIYSLCRRLGAGEAGSTMAGASFALSPFMLGWTPLASVIATVAWVPWMLWAVTRVARDASPLVGLGWLGVFFGLAVTAGHLQFVAYAGMAGLIFGLVLIFSVKGKAARALPLLAGLALGACLGAPTLIPVMKYGEFSHRRGAPTEEGYTAYANSALKVWEMGTLVNPVGLGSPRMRILEEAPDAQPFSTYWPAYSKLGANWAEGAISPGPLAILGLCFLPFVWRRFKETDGLVGLSILGLFGLLLALGTPFNRLLYFGVPGWSSTGSPGRAAILFVMAACALAGLVVDRLTREELEDRKFRYGLMAFALVGFATLGLGASPPPAVPGFEEVLKAASAAAAALALPVIFIMIALAAQAPIFSRLPFAARYRPFIWPGTVVVCALLWGATSIVPMGKAIEPVQPPGVGPHDRVAVVNRDWSLFGPVRGVQYPPNTMALSRVREIGGYDSLLHRDTAALLREINQQDPAPPANGNMMLVKPTSSLSELMNAGVSHVLGDLDPAEVSKMAPMVGRVSRAGGSAEIVGETFNIVIVKTSGANPGQLVLRDRGMEGWTASTVTYVDGPWKDTAAKQGTPGNFEVVKEKAQTISSSKELDISLGRWLQVDVPAGQQTVLFRYEAPGFKTGLIFFGVGLLVLIGVFAIGRSKLKALHLPENRLDGVVEGDSAEDMAVLVGDKGEPGGTSA